MYGKSGPVNLFLFPRVFRLISHLGIRSSKEEFRRCVRLLSSFVPVCLLGERGENSLNSWAAREKRDDIENATSHKSKKIKRNAQR